METFKPTLRQRAQLLFTQPKLAFLSVVPGLTFYGGATITSCHDATGMEYTVACAKDNATGKFSLYYLRGDVPVKLTATGRGSVWISLYDGKAYWRGWEGSTKQGAIIPGFVPFPSLISLQAQISALVSNGIGGAPILIPPAGAIAGLYRGTYTAAEFDTPAETALRVGKQLAALNELVERLIAAGVLA